MIQLWTFRATNCWVCHIHIVMYSDPSLKRNFLKSKWFFLSIGYIIVELDYPWLYPHIVHVYNIFVRVTLVPLLQCCNFLRSRDNEMPLYLSSYMQLSTWKVSDNPSKGENTLSAFFTSSFWHSQTCSRECYLCR